MSRVLTHRTRISSCLLMLLQAWSVSAKIGRSAIICGGQLHRASRFRSSEASWVSRGCKNGSGSSSRRSTMSNETTAEAGLEGTYAAAAAASALAAEVNGEANGVAPWQDGGAGGLEAIPRTYAAVAAGSAVAAEANGVPAEAKSSQQGGGAGGAKEETSSDVNYGFSRPEMHSESLVGTVQFFERHMFLCSESKSESWPSNVEAAGGADFERLPSEFALALRTRKNDIPLKTRMTLCEATESSAGDVLLFPDMLCFKGLGKDEVATFVEDVLVSGEEWSAGSGRVESITGSHIFVCAHTSRDKRCGACGPVLIEKFQEEITQKGLEGQIFVRPCSHIGGHKYAGNVIVFSSSGTGSVAGHWFGYVAPEDVSLILDEHIGKGKIIDRLWRGQMGVTEADQKLALQNRQNDGKNPNSSNSNGCVASPEQNEIGNSGCCQASSNGNSSCCQSSSKEATAKEKEEIPSFMRSSSSLDAHLIFPLDDSSSDEEPMDPRIPLWGGYYIPLPKWVGDWEKEDTNAALAIVAAAACVAGAVHFSREATKE